MFAGSEWRLAAGVVYTVLLLFACVTDVRWRRIPNALVVVLVVTGFAFSMAIEPVWPGLVRAVSGLALGFSIWIMFHVAGAWELATSSCCGGCGVARSWWRLAGGARRGTGRRGVVARRAHLAAQDA